MLNVNTRSKGIGKTLIMRILDEWTKKFLEMTFLPLFSMQQNEFLMSVAS